MQRSVSEVDIGDSVRYRTRLEYPQERGDRQALIALLSSLSSSPDLISCGFFPPQKLVITHTGTGWVVEAEALISKGG